MRSNTLSDRFESIIKSECAFQDMSMKYLVCQKTFFIYRWTCFDNYKNRSRFYLIAYFKHTIFRSMKLSHQNHFVYSHINRTFSISTLILTKNRNCSVTLSTIKHMNVIPKLLMLIDVGISICSFEHFLIILVIPSISSYLF